MNKIKEFAKKEPILLISGLLSIISCFFTRPDKAYLYYINYRTIIILFCLMAVTCGLKKSGSFDLASRHIINSTSNIRKIAQLLTIFSFILSMFVTNDVSLITLVPLTLVVFSGLSEDILILTLVEETIAANLGSMLTPFGNPQNLYLSSYFNIGFMDFLKLMAPYTILSLLILMLQTMLIPADTSDFLDDIAETKIDKKSLLIYCLLFWVSILSIIRILNYWILFIIVFFFILIYDRKIFKDVNYSLLITFVFFFVLIGNLGRIAPIRSFLEKMILGRESLTAVLASQIMSNVPAAILLSGFTDKGESLVIGSNLGGLGSLIASMASVITFQFYIKKKNSKSLKFLLIFTIFNILDLLILLALYYILK